jgi:hypothetical protein
MDPSKVAARFFAFAFYLNSGLNERGSLEETGRYARRNWKWFLPYVHEDLERFLTGPAPLSKKSTPCPPAVASKPPRRKIAV